MSRMKDCSHDAKPNDSKKKEKKDRRQNSSIMARKESEKSNPQKLTDEMNVMSGFIPLASNTVV